MGSQKQQLSDDGDGFEIPEGLGVLMRWALRGHSVVTGSPEAQKMVLWHGAGGLARPQGQIGGPRSGTIVSREASLFLFK